MNLTKILTKNSKERTSKGTSDAWEMRKKRQNMMTASMHPIKWIDKFAFFVRNMITCRNGVMKCLCLKNEQSWENKEDALYVLGQDMLPRIVAPKAFLVKNVTNGGNEFTQENEPADALIPVTPSEPKRETVLQTTTLWIETPVKRQLTLSVRRRKSVKLCAPRHLLCAKPPQS